MKLETFSYTMKNGWSIQSFPALDSDNTLVLLFCAPEFIKDSSPIDELVKSYPKSKIMGCSTAGEIFGAHISDSSISVAVIQFEKTQLKMVRHKIESSEQSYDQGREIANDLLADQLRGIFVLSEGLIINGSELLKGFDAVLKEKENVVVTGGLAGDGSRFKETWVIYQGKIYTQAIVAVGLYGENIQVGYAARGGWDIFGPERHITRSHKNVLYELNDQPALEVYKRYLGDRAAELPLSGLLFPLAIRKNLEDDNHIVRTILGVNEEDQSLIFAGDMPTGYFAQLMRANFDRLIVSAGETGSEAMSFISPKDPNSTTPILSIAVSCVGRRLILGERSEEETESVLDSLMRNTQQVGYYSYGEISPYSNGTCDLHNQTMALTILYET